MTKLGKSFLVCALILLWAAAGASAQGTREDRRGHGRAVVTVLAAHGGQQDPAAVPAASVQIKINGKDATVTGWKPLRGAADRTELVLLIDGSARTSLAGDLGELKDFVQEMPNHTEMAVAYMMNGRAAFTAPFSADPAQVVRGLHIPGYGAGQNGSPYFCLTDLAEHWPAHDARARRVVLMITDGVDEYNMRYDPDDPYVQQAIDSSLRTGLVVYSIYWPNQGRAASSAYETNAGQSLLGQVSDATGGVSFWQGYGDPVTLVPSLQELRRRLRNQYLLTFEAPLAGKPYVANLKVKVDAPSVKVEAPQQTYLFHAASPGE